MLELSKDCVSQIGLFLSGSYVSSNISGNQPLLYGMVSGYGEQRIRRRKESHERNFMNLPMSSPIPPTRA